MRPRRIQAAPDLAEHALPGEAATIRAAQEALDGDRHGLRALWPFLGPAFIASVAYVDPGNFATDIAGGAKYGYLLLWAVLASNLMANAAADPLGQARHRHRPQPCGGLPGIPKSSERPSAAPRTSARSVSSLNIFLLVETFK